MRELLETQRRLTMTCQQDPATCDRWTLQAIEVSKKPAVAGPIAPPPADEPLAGWLKPFKMPDQFPVRDEPALRSMFDFSTKNIAGRSAFQSKLFECSAYQDIFDSTLLKYGAPHWLTAVVFQESACNRLATSQVGAKGLWQFMPESARAYGLRVVDGEIDERLNPIKSTDAAVHFFTDLARELGAWDLALAAYNMGPFGVLARMTQVGGRPGFWELAHAGLLPDETTGYVPAIEAYAIALENLHALKFIPYGKHLESTAEVIVKPGTRLSLIALAASTTTVRIHDLNPEFLRDVVPEDETTARVPDTEAHRAQAVIDSWNPTDRRDTCVPPEFDWGAQQFETSKYAKKCAQAGGTGP
jgi:soluble lytic murein transglycosylase-like protein